MPEQIEQRLRPHWIQVVKVFFWTALAIVVPIWWLLIFNTSGTYQQLNPTLVGVTASIYLVLILALFAVSIRNWLRSLAFITNKRVLVVNHGMRDETIWAFDLSRIEKASVIYPTRLAQAFRFGNVRLSGENEAIELRAISHPEQLVTKIIALSGDEAVVTSHSNQETQTNTSQSLVGVPSPQATEPNLAKSLLVADSIPQLITSGEITDQTGVTTPDQWSVPPLISRDQSIRNMAEALPDRIELKEGEPVYL